MKRFYLFLIVAVSLFATQQTTSAKIWRVNNNPGKSCDFTTLTAALRATKVTAKDTIHIEGSVTEYGKDGQTATNCDTVRKHLVIIGPGYLLSANDETQHNKESAKVRTLHIASTAAGTVIAGIEQATPGTNFLPNATSYALVTGYNTNVTYSEGRAAYAWGAQPTAYKIRIEADNVTISHSKLFYVDLFNFNRGLTNITITKCFFNPGIISCRSGTNPVSNLIISNNYFRNDGGTQYTTSYHVSQIDYNCVIDLKGYAVIAVTSPGLPAVYALYPWPAVTPTIQNNTFYRAFNIQARSTNLTNNIFFCNAYGTSWPQLNGLPVWDVYTHASRNNIIYSGGSSPWTSPTSTNNYGGMQPNINGNQYSNVPEVNWFAASTTTQNIDKSYVLGSSSPAKGAEETSQRGMFGGLSPYVLAGLYTIPAVWEITLPGNPTGEVPSTGFEVRVRVKSH